MKTFENHKTTTKPPYPEVLPWFAKKSGISETRAKALWDLTCLELPEDGSDVAALAKARMALFIECVGHEAGLPLTPEYTEQPDQFAWLYRHYARLADMALVSGGAVARFWQQAMTPSCLAR